MNFYRIRNVGVIGLPLSILLIALLPLTASAGSQTFNSSGTFTVPDYVSLTVTVNGAGGGGGGGANFFDENPGGVGVAGGGSSFNSNVSANGGGGGGGGDRFGNDGSPGSNGTASGGDTNSTGGGAAGGGGGGGVDGGGNGGSGGAGGRADKTYSAGALTLGAGISVVVGNGGSGGAGTVPAPPGSTGSNGSVSITWTANAPTVTAISPSSAGNSSSASITSVTGTGFETGATVKLYNSGQSIITCTGFAFTNSTTLSSGTCPITDAATGAWDVAVTNTDSQTGTSTGAFDVFFVRTTITLTKSATVAGDVSVAGTISKGSGTFVIDHPLDPKNKLLYHSFVESPDAMNIYDGIATLDKNGEAVIELPKYFLALNKDFRYLGTAIGQPMPNLFLAKEVHRWFFGLFGKPVIKISGGAPNGRVSWQVTGVRQDPFILAHPIIVEVEKGPDQLVNKGQYLFPEFYSK